MYDQDYFNIVDKSYKNFDSLRFKTVIGVINKLPKGGLLLDAGSGGGHYIDTLSNNHRSIGIEYSKNGIKDSKKRISKSNIVNGNLMEKLPFKDNIFNIILCSEVMEHLSNIDIIFSEFRRVLKTNGYVVITVPNFTKMSFEYIREIISYKDPTHVHRYPLYKWKNILSKHFKIVNHFTSSFSPSFLLYFLGIDTGKIMKIEHFFRRIPIFRTLGRECIFILKLKN